MTWICRICSHQHAISVLDMGPMPPVNTLHTAGTPITFHPLHMVECAACGFWQLKTLPIRKEIFPEIYPYRSRTTKELLTNFQDLHSKVKGCLPTNPRILDIGGNDGSLLRYFDGDRYNVEPTFAGAESTDIARWIDKFWGLSTAKELGSESMDLILCTNVFAHADNLHDLAFGVKVALAPDGLFVLEVQDRNSLVFDTIYHEHVAYYRDVDISNLLHLSGLSLIKVEKIPTHGGSIRCYAKHQHKVKVAAPELDKEYLPAYKLQQTTRQQVIDLMRHIESRKAKGQKLWGIGAPSRATTLLHYTGLHYHLDGVAEIATSPKVGLNMPGTRVPVLTDKDMLNDWPDAVVVLSWHLGDGIANRLKAMGFKGEIIMPLPELRVIS